MSDIVKRLAEAAPEERRREIATSLRRIGETYAGLASALEECDFERFFSIIGSSTKADTDAMVRFVEFVAEMQQVVSGKKPNIGAFSESVDELTSSLKSAVAYDKESAS